MDLRPNWIDRAVGWAAPERAVRRLRARAAWEVTRRNFEGASRSPRMKGWQTAGQNATTATPMDLATLRQRSRALTRNNGWAKQALRVIRNNVVGQGIVPRLLGEDARRKPVQALWRAWAATSREADARGRRTLYGLQRLVMSTVAESGECLVRRRRRRGSDGLTVPLQLEVLEPDLLDSTKDGGTKNGGEIIQGIEFDKFDRVRGYHLYRRHPGDASHFRDLESRFVPASEILHVFDEERAGQVRGAPFPHAAIVRLRDFDECEDAKLLQQKIAACFVAIVHDTDFGGLETEDEAEQEKMRERVEPGMLYKVPPGKDVKFGTPPVASDFGEYGATVLRGVAAAYGITYEELSGDYSRVNFSSGRMGWLKADRNVKAWQSDIMVAQFCLGVWSWWTEALELAHGIEVDDLAVSWDAPRREMLDPVKETKARQEGVRAGFLSLSDAIREGGRDPREVLLELKEDAELLEELGLKLTTDPHTVAAAPGATPPGDPDGDKDDEEEVDDEDEKEQAKGREARLLSAS